MPLRPARVSVLVAAALAAGCRPHPAPVSAPAAGVAASGFTVAAPAGMGVLTVDTTAAGEIGGGCAVRDPMAVRVPPARSVPIPNARPPELAARTAMPNGCAPHARAVSGPALPRPRD